ncbi:MAG: slipin family protein [Phycisphaeraceae bacterium]
MNQVLRHLEQEHRTRQLARLKVRLPIVFVSVVVAILTLAASAAVGLYADLWALLVLLPGLALAAVIYYAAQLLAEWDRAVVLRFGRFHDVRGPGFFLIVPVVDSIARVVDMRVRTTSFTAESILTRDTVSVHIDAIAFWHVWDARKALLEVESYYHAITLAVQTALRDMIGTHSLAEVLAERERMNHALQQILQAKTEAWGISVTSLEIRDIAIPDNLKDVMSKQAQAERERQARTILGEAEIDLAHKFAEAASVYAGNPAALQLRAMNIVYEGLRSGGSLMLVPSSALDTMNVGSLAALDPLRRAIQTPPLPGQSPQPGSNPPPPTE